jgi:hypothetical protein
MSRKLPGEVEIVNSKLRLESDKTAGLLTTATAIIT